MEIKKPQWDQSEDIVSLFSMIQRRRSRLVGQFYEGSNTFSCRVLYVNNEVVLLTESCSPVMAERILAAEKLYFSATFQRTPMQFEVPGMVACEYQGMAAFKMPLPESVEFGRRRQFERLREDTARSHCRLADVRGSEIKAKLLDLSVAGMGLQPDGVSEGIQVGDIIDDVRLELPPVASLSLQIRICSQLSAVGDNRVRLGAEFMNLPQSSYEDIQQYLRVRIG